MEEVNICGVNNLDADARLPPRKRLLAGLKKQSCDGSSPSSPLSSISTDMSSRIRDLLNANFNGSNLSKEEIVEVARSSALAAAKVAAAARAKAVEKAAAAAKAAANAKKALELVASLSDTKSQKERGLMKDKPKKHVPVRLLYKKRKRGEKGETDAELALRLHQVMNSSPRILRKPVGSDSKVQNRKKHRKRLVLEPIMLANGGVLLEGKTSSNLKENDVVRGENVVQPDDKASECNKIDSSEVDALHVNEEEEVNHSMAQILEDTISAGRKRGRIKQKKLSLSLCSVRDRENTKEEPKSRRFQSGKVLKGKPDAMDDPLLTIEASNEVEVSNEAVSSWQRKEFSATQCYAGSNILGSLCSNPTVTTGSAMVEVDH